MKAHKKEFTDHCIVEAKVSTTGFRGGDSGAGGKTIIEISETAGDFFFEGRTHMCGDKSLIIEAGGDAELRTLIKSFKFIYQTLEKHKND